MAKRQIKKPPLYPAVDEDKAEIQQVEALLKLCRQYEVSEIQTPEFTIKLFEAKPRVSGNAVAKLAEALAKGELTPEQALFASVEQVVPKQGQEE